MKIPFTVLIILSFLFLSACSSLHHHSQKEEPDGPPWTNFKDAAERFDTIVIAKTKTNQLPALTGVDLEKTKGVEILGTPKIMSLYTGDAGMLTTIPYVVMQCIEEHRADCRGYVIKKSEIDEKGEGSLMLRAMGFKETDRITGWFVEFFIIVQDNTIIDKGLIVGSPNGYEKVVTDTDPLGFLRGFFDTLTP